jgi:hypothetical protein
MALTKKEKKKVKNLLKKGLKSFVLITSICILLILITKN